MAGLGVTTAKLARMKRQWQSAYEAGTGNGSSPARLTESVDFGTNPGNLRMLAYVPEDCPSGAPLVVVLHGCTQSAEGYDHGAGWSTLADRFGFAVLFPEQQRANNPNVCFNWFVPGDITRERGEALSIRQMIERMVSDHDLDRRRVFVTGLSAGGAMATVMLATYPDVFAGGAIIAGLPYGVAGSVQEALDAMHQGSGLPERTLGELVRAASPHKGPWPKVSIWHGSADGTVMPRNADALIRQWTDVHGVGQRPPEENVVDGYPRRVWRDAAGVPVVESYTISGMGHGTPIAAAGPDGAGTAGPFILESGISSSTRIAEFWGIAAPSQAAKAGPRPRPEVAKDNGAAVAKPRSGLVPRLRPSVGGATRQNITAGALDPQTVITKALKKAGLLKS
jgi:feruloyl esterase